ncbi:hypothetical protein [Taibaiella soli]|uniref:DUF4292 domain-containing protein n=1 Tax=Taibaiella soli TaxID=1649169 RepID=A0A2W2AQV5_9BACT|nr:hypothetical protein [Taibaiella soli]PZF74800.1 hypothetical protein DN068_00970 [Taibaiella soli]
MMKKIKKISLVVGMLAASIVYHSHAAIPGPLKWMEQLKVLNSPDLSYAYIIQLVNGKGVVVDSIKGRIYRSNPRYVDSSARAITAFDGRFFCKLDNDFKMATVCDVPVLKKKMNIRMSDEPSAVIMFSDSVIAKYGKLKVDTTASQFVVRLNIHADETTDVTLTAKLARKNYLLEQIVIETAEPKAVEETDTWIRRCVLYNIQSKVAPEQFNLQRFFTVADTNIILNKRYANYKLSTIIK